MDDDDGDGATDCPICLCPIPSAPWGVCSPCGHPYHRECWDQVTANHAAGRGGGGSGRRRRNPSCAICNGATKGFVPVFVSLGNEDDGGVCVAVGGAKEGGDNGAIELEGDDASEELELEEERDRLWRELRALCQCEEGTTDENNRRRGGGGEDEDGVIDMTGSDRCVANICGAIDLTQNTPRAGKSSTGSDGAIATARTTEGELFEQKQERIREILPLLERLRERMLGAQRKARLRAPSAAAGGRQVQRLRSKVRNLQDANAELTSRASSLRAAHEGATAKLEELRRTVLDRTVEAERARSKHDALKSRFQSMEDSYEKHVARSSLDHASLKEQIAGLQEKYRRLEDRAGLEDAREMDEARRRYGRMAQELHDAKRANARLEAEAGRRERELEGMRRRERERREELERSEEGGRGPAGRGADSSADYWGGDNARRVVGDPLTYSFGAKASSNEAGASGKGIAKPLSNGQTGWLSARKVSVEAAFSSRGKAAPSANVPTGWPSSRKVAAEDGVPIKGNSHPSTNASTSSLFSSSLAARKAAAGRERRSSKATAALDRASSRRLKRKLLKPLQSSGTGAGGAPVGERAPEGASPDVQLMMRTDSRSSKKRRRAVSRSSSFNGNSRSNSEQFTERRDREGSREQTKDRGRTTDPMRFDSDSEEDRGGREMKRRKKSEYVPSTSARKTNGVTAVLRRGNISSFFKPVASVDMTEC